MRVLALLKHGNAHTPNGEGTLVDHLHRTQKPALPSPLGTCLLLSFPHARLMQRSAPSSLLPSVRSPLYAGSCKQNLGGCPHSPSSPLSPMSSSFAPPPLPFLGQSLGPQGGGMCMCHWPCLLAAPVLRGGGVPAATRPTVDLTADETAAPSSLCLDVLCPPPCPPHVSCLARGQGTNCGHSLLYGWARAGVGRAMCWGGWGRRVGGAVGWGCRSSWRRGCG